MLLSFLWCRRRDCLGRSHLTAIPCFVFCNFITSNKSTPLPLEPDKASPCGVLRPPIQSTCIKKDSVRSLFMVSKTGLEPVQISPHAPQTCASTIPPLRHKWNYSIFKVFYFIFVAEQSLSLLPSPSKATFSCFLVGRVPLRHKWNYSIFKVIYFIFTGGASSIYKHQIPLQINLIMDKKACQIRN